MDSTRSPATPPSPKPGASSRAGQSSGAYFYLAMALVIGLVVAIGFGRTIDKRLLHAATPRPLILFVHAAFFLAWVVTFIAQTALIRVRRVVWHRRLGVFGTLLGATMPVVTMAAVIAMARLHRAEGDTGGESFLIVPVWDMLAFTTTFCLAIAYRKNRDYHRRLMLIASCGLTVAAFARFPGWLMPENFWYVAVDLLILMGVAHDWQTARRIHPVYRYGFPLVALGQAITMWIYLSEAPAWVWIANKMLG